MSISGEAQQVIKRPLDPRRVRQRPGRGAAKFDYIPTDYAIDLLNEAFHYQWDTRIVSHVQVDNTIIVQLELVVPAETEGFVVRKQQYGSCDFSKGVTVGDAFKGAASDALKKCATQLGVAIELYQDDSASAGGFTPPKSPTKPVAPAGPSTPSRSSISAPPRPSMPSIPPMPTRARPASASTPSDASRLQAPPASPLRAASKPADSPAPAAKSRRNPFETGVNTSVGPNATQLNALNNLAEKKGLSQADMIARAAILDPTNNPKLTFDELTHSEAIQVIKAAQQ